MLFEGHHHGFLNFWLLSKISKKNFLITIKSVFREKKYRRFVLYKKIFAFLNPESSENGEIARSID